MNKITTPSHLHMPRVADSEKYRNRVVKPLAVLSAAALIASGIIYEVDKDKKHSIDYLNDDKQVSKVVQQDQTIDQLIEEVDGTNLGPQTKADLEAYIGQQGTGQDHVLEYGQAVHVPVIGSQK